MAMVVLLNQGNCKYMDVLHYWDGITRLQKCWWEFRASGKNDIPSSVTPLCTPFFERPPPQPTFLWFLPWQGASWFDRQEPSHLSIFISIKKIYFWLFAFLIHSLKKNKKKTPQKTCGFIGTKKDKDFNKQTSEVQLPSTSVKHLPNTKPVAVIVISICILCKVIVVIGGKSRMGGRYKCKSGSTLYLWGPCTFSMFPSLELNM